MFIFCKYMVDDQCQVSWCLDVFIFMIELFSEDLMLVGFIDVELFVSIIGIDVDWVVKFIDVYFDDYLDYEEI